MLSCGRVRVETEYYYVISMVLLLVVRQLLISHHQRISNVNPWVFVFTLDLVAFLKSVYFSHFFDILVIGNHCLSPLDWCQRSAP